jgi:ribosomal protein S18 acetylase RimI-like enzyme
MVFIRRIVLREGELFRRIRLESLRESPYAFSSTYESALKRCSESWSEQADSTAQGSDRATFIAFAGDSPVGIAALYRNPGERPEVGELLQVWVSPEYRSKGVAEKILEAVFYWAAANDFQTVIANVAKGNERAVRFYRKYGFRLAVGAPLDGRDDYILIKEVTIEGNSDD